MIMLENMTIIISRASLSPPASDMANWGGNELQASLLNSRLPGSHKEEREPSMCDMVCLVPGACQQYFVTIFVGIRRWRAGGSDGIKTSHSYKPSVQRPGQHLHVYTGCIRIQCSAKVGLVWIMTNISLVLIWLADLLQSLDQTRSDCCVSFTPNS